MKYPLFILPNQSPNQVVIQAKREVLESITKDFGSNLQHRGVIVSITNRLRASSGDIIKMQLTRDTANELLKLVGLSY